MKSIIKKPVMWFFATTGILILIKLALLITTKGEYWGTLVWGFNTRSLFYDHVLHVKYAMSAPDIYELGGYACFPPIAYVFYGALANMCAVNAGEGATELIFTNVGLLTLVLLYSFISVCIALALVHMLSGHLPYGWTVCFIIAFFMSGIYLVTCATGNVTMLVALFILTALCLKDSPVKALRELSLIFLALAAGFKLYPAVLGLIWLKEKRYKECVRLLIYGLLVFFAPFAFFGGIRGFVLFFNNLRAVSQEQVRPMSLYGIVNIILSRFLDEPIAMRLADVANILYFVIVVFLFFRYELNWKTTTLLTGLLIFFNKATGSYCAIFWIVPMVMFIREKGLSTSDRIADLVYGFLFGLSLAGLPVMVQSSKNGDGAAGTMIISMYIITLIIMAELIFSLPKRGDAS